MSGEDVRTEPVAPAVPAVSVDIPASDRTRGRPALLFASLISGVANYGFGLLCIHMLGAPTYAALASVTALSMIITVPLSGLQAAYGRDAAFAVGSGDRDSLSQLYRYGERHLLRLQLITFILAGALVPALVWLGNIPIQLAVGLPLLTLGATAVPVLGGFLQGTGRYHGLALVIGLAGSVRFLGAPLGILVAGALGALVAGVVGTMLAATYAYWSTRRYASHEDGHSTDHRRPATTRLAMLALVAYGALSNLDLTLAPMLMSERAAGNYAAASIAGRGMAFVAMTVSLVLLTSTARRISQGLDTKGPLLRALGGIATIGGLLAAGAIVVPDEVFARMLGTTGDVNVLVALSTLGLSAVGIVNTLLNYALAHGTRWYVFVVMGVAGLFAPAAFALADSPLSLAVLTLTAAVACILVFFGFSRGPSKIAPV